MSVRTAIAKVLPQRVKRAIKACFRLLRREVKRTAPDRPSALVIKSFGEFDVAYRHDTADEDTIRHSFGNDIFFAGVPDYTPKADHVIIDVGAHIGTFALLASSKAPAGRVYAIEASEDTFNFLRVNVALNRRYNVECHHLALADKGGTCTLHHGFGNWSHSTVKNFEGSGEEVAACTLATFLEANRIGECHFMKMNCEGAEFPILMSTPHAMLRRVRKMLVLYHCDLWERNSSEELLAHLRACGFGCVVKNHTESRGWIVATRMDPMPGSGPKK